MPAWERILRMDSLRREGEELQCLAQVGLIHFMDDDDKFYLQLLLHTDFKNLYPE